MASFTDSMTLKINVITGNAVSQFKAMSTSVKEADGAFGKMKAAGSGAFDLLKANAGAFALSAGTALVGFGAQAVQSFQKTALGAGELRDKLGLTADAASRWQEVAGDLGISTDTLATAMGRMLKTAGATPQVFEQLGVSIARSADGTVDANATFLNVINTLHNMKDPAERAAAAQKLLGKSWMESAELIELGAAGVKARLDEVSGAKIIDDSEIDKARQFRDSLDDLHDAVENVSITVGQELVPALTEAADTANSLVGPLQSVYDKFQQLTNVPGIKQIYDNFAPWRQLPTRLHQVESAWTSVKDAFTTGPEDISASLNLQNDSVNRANALLSTMTGNARDAGDAAEEQATKLYNSKAAADAAAEGQKALADQLQRVTDIMQGQLDGFQSLADSQIAAQDAYAAFGAALQGEKDAADASAEAIRQHGAASSEAADASRDAADAANQTRDAAISLANANVQLAADQAAASGASLGAAASLDEQNRSLLNTAATASGPARSAILSYIFALNGIPPEKQTEILTLLDQGLVAEARAAIDNASRNRQTAIAVDENGAAAADAAINNAARNRTSVINVLYNADLGPIGGSNFRAGGGPVSSGQTYVVGEEGPEVFVPKQSGTILPNAGSGSPVGMVSGGSGQVFNIHLNVAVGVGTNPVAVGQEVIKVLIPALKTGGAGPVRKALGLNPVGAVA